METVTSKEEGSRVNARLDVRGWGGSGPAWDRVRAALMHERADRIPITAWRHFPGFEDSEGLARVHLAFQMRYGFDMVVFTPPFGYTAEVWGFDRGEESDEHGRPTRPVRPFEGMRRWPSLRGEGVSATPFSEVIRAVRLTRRNLAEDVPVILTVYGPLTTALFLRGDEMRRDLRGIISDEDSAEIAPALEVIHRVTSQFLDAALEVVDGIYYISYFTCAEHTGDEEIALRALDRDLRPLVELEDRQKLLALHMHGEDLLFDEVMDYPADIFNWHDRWAKPSLRDARMKTEAVLMGGINEADTMHRETSAAVSLQVGDAVSQVEGRGIIISPGGPINLDTPSENIRAAVAAVEELG
ncbi:MAG: uroporphyrinogen decarboxylase family protein [Bacillota bacterium]